MTSEGVIETSQRLCNVLYSGVLGGDNGGGGKKPGNCISGKGQTRE